jgi:hypothetical protein
MTHVWERVTGARDPVPNLRNRCVDWCSVCHLVRYGPLQSGNSIYHYYDYYPDSGVIYGLDCPGVPLP